MVYITWELRLMICFGAMIGYKSYKLAAVIFFLLQNCTIYAQGLGISKDEVLLEEQVLELRSSSWNSVKVLKHLVVMDEFRISLDSFDLDSYLGQSSVYQKVPGLPDLERYKKPEFDELRGSFSIKCREAAGNYANQLASLSVEKSTARIKISDLDKTVSISYENE